MYFAMYFAYSIRYSLLFFVSPFAKFSESLWLKPWCEADCCFPSICRNFSSKRSHSNVYSAYGLYK